MKSSKVQTRHIPVPVKQVSAMSNSDSLSAGSSRPSSGPVGSEQHSDESLFESLSVGHVERERIQEIRRKGKQKMDSPSSERTVEGVRDRSAKEMAEVSYKVPATGEGGHNPTTDWVTRPPLLMEHIPRIATDELASELRVGELEVLRVAFHIPANVEIRILGPEWRASRPPVGWRCIFEDQLKGGLRFPIPPFVCNVPKSIYWSASDEQEIVKPHTQSH